MTAAGPWTDGRLQPHRYVRRRISSVNWPQGGRPWSGWTADDPCNVCGGSQLLSLHTLYQPHPRRLPAGDGHRPGPGFQDLEYHLEAAR